MEMITHIIGFIPPLLEALPMTLFLTAIAGVLGLGLGTLMALARVGGNPIFSWPSQAVSLFMRGTPLLVQLYLIYYGLGELLPGTWVRQSFLWPYLRDGLWYAVLVFTVNQAAYNAEVLRGAILAVPKGQIEAAKAIGMPKGRIMRRIVLPQAFHQCMPVLSSDLIILLKSTSLASTIAIMDVMGVARALQRKSYLVFEPLIAAGILYFIVVFVVSMATRYLEKRLTGYRTR